MQIEATSGSIAPGLLLERRPRTWLCLVFDGRVCSSDEILSMGVRKGARAWPSQSFQMEPWRVPELFVSPLPQIARRPPSGGATTLLAMGA